MSAGQRPVGEVVHTICDFDGTVIGHHHRIYNVNGGKDRVWWTGPEGKSGLKGRHPADYAYGGERLADRPKEEIILVEGEPAADALLELGFLAIATVTGAGTLAAPRAISRRAAEHLAGRRVWLWPDADANGLGVAHMGAIAAVLAAAGVAELRVINWPGAPDHGDAVDFLEAAGDAEAVRGLLAAAGPWRSSTGAANPVGLPAPPGGQPDGEPSEDGAEDPGGRRRGTRGWEFDPPLEVVVIATWRLRVRYAERGPGGGVVAQVELLAGDEVHYCDRLLMGSAHGRRGFVIAITESKGRALPKHLPERLPRGLIDLGAAVESRVRELEDALPDATSWKKSNRPWASDSGLPMIWTTGRRLREIAADCVGALVAANVSTPRYFAYGDAPARLTHASPASVEVLTPSAFRGVLDRVADFWGGGLMERHSVYPPYSAVGDLLALPISDLKLPRLRRVATTPVFARSTEGARLLATDGFDEESGVYIDLSDLGLIPTMPAAGALELIFQELLVDFPFTDAAGRAHALGALLQPFVRDLIEGPTPLIAFDAPTERTGKGLFVSAIATVATGKPAFPMALPGDDDTNASVSRKTYGTMRA